MADDLTSNDALLVGLDCDPKAYIATTASSSYSSSQSHQLRPCLSHLQTTGHGHGHAFDPVVPAQDFAAPGPEWQHFQQQYQHQHHQSSFPPPQHQHQHQHHHRHDVPLPSHSHLQYLQQPPTSAEPPPPPPPPQQFTTTAAYDLPLQASPDFAAAAASAPQWDDSALVDASYIPLSAAAAPSADTLMPFNFQDLHAGLTSIPRVDGLPDMQCPTGLVDTGSSPTDTYLEVRSLTSSSSDNSWSVVEHNHHNAYHHQHQPHQHSFDSSPPFPDHAAVSNHDNTVFINPSQTLHNRSLSESSYSDLDLDLDLDHHHQQQQHPRNSFGSFLELSHPLSSPTSDGNLELEYNPPRRVSCDLASHSSSSPTAISPVALVRPMPVINNNNSNNKTSNSGSPTRSPKAHSQSSGTSPPTRRPSRKSPIAAKTAETRVRKLPHNSSSNRPEVSEKRVGKRKGPLNPDQRKQASEIRKLRACLRCKFLKKTCDKGEPCAGCQPSHARLWQVPCTRIDIKDIAYFMKDWKADYERHVSLGFSVGNIKGFSDVERTLFITHGYGQVLPVAAREVYVHDERCFDLDWVEAMNRNPSHFELKTARLSAGIEGVSVAMLSEYLDRHIDGNGSFEKFVDDYFEGTPFLTQMLKTAFRYYFRTKLPVVRKALKLILAYNLTMHVTMVEGVGELEGFVGKVEEESSKYKGKTMAPVMINFQIKCAMASLWREMQKDVLEELSGLYSSVYSGDKLKHWPTIFILACILLAVWEEMQFDCHYRVPDAAVVDKFCTDMETTPVGVVVGLFQAISQKLPAFSEWDSQKHHHILNSNPDVCHTMTEVRQHVNQYESYLRGRPQSTFDRNDFDCLSNKFLSRLVIRAN